MKRVLFFTLFLSGCSPWSGDFDCGIGQGMKCASLSKVNKAMDRGEIDLDDDEILCNDSLCEKQCTQNQKTSAPFAVHIWIAPKEDTLSPLNSTLEDGNNA